ncbi:MAG: AAA family ATPase [Waddliaceae bacterium]|nr:AAA family ATPase [Waddliaceae bacterium]MBT3578400.1 AAA family ATPase [Waddliaceae bacterium]MBT4445286.1 AAA family ATPase [Waddliaceae bacterium]MBT6928557.1 AAA family ATPase [Waddliaceae bacterium]MBT7264564.1 AAA family ATPase [Waddliaceae bacterium]
MKDLIGNDIAKKCLQRMVEGGTIGNSLLFAGNEGVGKTLFAIAMAKMILSQGKNAESNVKKISSGNHPDIHIYKPEGKLALHSIESMRMFIEEVNLPPYEADKKIFIIVDADRMLTFSANALLKTFEEPTLDAIIILVTDNPDALLPTILSRCKKITFHALKEEEIQKILENNHGCSQDEAQHLAWQARGSIGRALRIKNSGDNTARKALYNILEKGHYKSYNDLNSDVITMTKTIEDKQKKLLEEVRSEHALTGNKDLTAIQKQAVQKEIEGAASVQSIRETTALLEDILTWYRDLHLLALDGDTTLLFHRDKEQQLRNTLEITTPPPLEYLQKIISETKLALARSLKPAAAFENLFLVLRAPRP